MTLTGTRMGEHKGMTELTLRVENSIDKVPVDAWDACANPAMPEIGD